MNGVMFGVKLSILGVIAALFAAGCFYPPVTQPPPDEQQEVIIPLPYDLAWDAVNAVITQNAFHVQAQDMTNGIIEAVGPRFTPAFARSRAACTPAIPAPITIT